MKKEEKLDLKSTNVSLLFCKKYTKAQLTFFSNCQKTKIYCKQDLQVIVVFYVSNTQVDIKLLTEYYLV